MEQFRNFVDSYLKWVYLIVVVIAYAAYAYLNQDLSEIEAREEKIQQTTQKIKNLNKKVEEAKAFEKEVEKKRLDIAELEKQLLSKKAELPKVFNVQELLSDLFSEAEQVGVEIKNITPGASETTGPNALYAALRTDIEVVGTFVQIFIFLDRLSKLKRLVGVPSFDLTPSGNGLISFKGTTVGQTAGRKLSGGEKKFRAISGKIEINAFRIK